MEAKVTSGNEMEEWGEFEGKKQWQSKERKENSVVVFSRAVNRKLP